MILEPLGVEVQAVNSNGDGATQAENVSNFVGAQVDGVIIGPVDPAGAEADLGRLHRRAASPPSVATAALRKQAAMDIGVTGWSTSAGRDLGLGVGKAAADYIAAEMGGKAKIVMVVCDSLGPVCSVRHDAIDEMLAAVPETEVVAMQDAFQTENRPAAGGRHADRQSRTPRWSSPTTRVAPRVPWRQSSSLVSAARIVVFGIDMTNVAGNYLLEEPAILLYTVGQDSYTMGKEAAEMLVNEWMGEAVARVQGDRARPGVPARGRGGHRAVPEGSRRHVGPQEDPHGLRQR